MTGSLLALALFAADPPLEVSHSPVYAADHFTLGAPVEWDLVGLAYGVRPEVLWRFGGEGARSRLRVAAGVLAGREYVYVPLAIGYRAIFRQDRDLRPLVGAGLEAQWFIISDASPVHRLGVPYLEGGAELAITDRLTLGGLAAFDVSLFSEPGFSLVMRFFATWRLG